jgi:hypothetical protein
MLGWGCNKDNSMVEIIVGVWVTSLIISIFVVSFNYHLTRQRLKSERLKTLNSNLAKVDLYWSNSLTADAIENDATKTLRNTLLMGLLGLASLIGLIFLIILVLSLHFLARSRKEIATFRSHLATDKNLTASEVQNFVNEFAQIL